VQCLPDGKGFVWLDNKFYTESKSERSRIHSASSIKERTEVLRQDFRAFCANGERLKECWVWARRMREQEWEQQVNGLKIMIRDD
jgi:hypothetical protein